MGPVIGIRSSYPSVLIVSMVVLCPLGGMAAAVEESPSASPWHYQLYLDTGFAYSDNDPGNHKWRSKTTTNRLDEPELFLAMGHIWKDALPGSRWGFDFGVQTGLDAEGLVTEPPPAALTPIDKADSYRHLYRANLSYLFDAGRGLRLTGGLINSFIGYTSFLAIDNPNYTRGYILDTVPYFMIGFEALLDVSESVDMGFYLTTGYNYLTHPNSVPSAGLQVAWTVSERTTIKQNVYYGPDQTETGIEFWRLLSDTIVEWKSDRFLLAGAFDFVSERQADLAGQPRYTWAAAAVWARWQLAERWSVALRPEAHWDRDGLGTGARQSIQSYTGTVKYQFSPRHQRLVGNLEVRYDRSTGDQGGFYKGPNNEFVSDLSLVLVGLVWSLDR